MKRPRRQFIALPANVLSDEPWLSLRVRVWLALTLHAGKDGRCWPSHARLMALTGADRRSLRGAIAELVDCGAVSIECVGCGRKATVYRVRSTLRAVREGGDSPPSEGGISRLQRAGILRPEQQRENQHNGTKACSGGAVRRLARAVDPEPLPSAFGTTMANHVDDTSGDDLEEPGF